MDNGNGTRVALITGGASGIGAAIARQLGAQGMRIVIADLDAEASERTVAELETAQLQASALAIDVTSPCAIETAFSELSRRHGRCDVLVNCAGIAKTYPFLEFPLDNWQRTLDVNLTGALLCSQHAGRVMQAALWGRIVNIGGRRLPGGRRSARVRNYHDPTAHRRHAAAARRL